MTNLNTEKDIPFSKCSICGTTVRDAGFFIDDRYVCANCYNRVINTVIDIEKSPWLHDFVLLQAVNMVIADEEEREKRRTQIRKEIEEKIYEKR